MVDQSEELSRRIQEVVDEERRQAADDRQQLMAQIGALVTAQAEAQEGRLAEKAALLQKGLRDAGSTLGSSVDRYDESMEAWDGKEEKLLEDVKGSRDTLKTRLQDDWNVSITLDSGSAWYPVANEQQVANEHSSSIQATAKSVHAQTVRIVDEQISDLGAQMQALDDFVSRARTENAQHHGAQVTAVEDVSSTVEGSYDAVGSHFRTAFDRVKGLGSDMDSETEAARKGLEPVEEEVCGPLAGLRGDVRSRALREYVPTGETPQKVAYRYPTELPHTASHEVLLAGLHATNVSPSKRRTPMSPVYEDGARSPLGSPGMGSDGALSPVARNDEPMEDTPVKQSSEERESTEEPTEPEVKQETEEAPADEEGDSTPRARGTSLREINPNLTAGFAFDPAASTASPENVTLPMLKKSGKRGIPRKGPVGRENMVPDMPKRKSPRLN